MTLQLKPSPTLKDFQNYAHELEIERGFTTDPVIQKCLLLGEEIGELFKAIRKQEKLKIDEHSTLTPISEELADILIYLFCIANKYDIDLEQAFREKEEINKKRVWK